MYPARVDHPTLIDNAHTVGAFHDLKPGGFNMGGRTPVAALVGRTVTHFLPITIPRAKGTQVTWTASYARLLPPGLAAQPKPSPRRPPSPGTPGNSYPAALAEQAIALSISPEGMGRPEGSLSRRTTNLPFPRAGSRHQTPWDSDSTLALRAAGYGHRGHIWMKVFSATMYYSSPGLTSLG